MPPFALTLSPGLRHDLLLVVECTFFTLSQPVLSCGGLRAWQISRGRLLVSEFAPPPVTFRPALSLAAHRVRHGLIFLQSPLFGLVVMAGTFGVLVQNQRTVEVQYGLAGFR